MTNGVIGFCNRVIEYSFYALFLLVPIALTNDTYELFEFNKMWLTFGITLIIFCFWSIKMVAKERFLIQRTPLDIPVILFLISQIIATIFSLDTHISLWGYYSRFNGGLYSIISYIFLFYAFVSNISLSKEVEGIDAKLLVKRSLLVSLAGGLFVALWGLPSHFGYDPTCLVFRGTFDVSCWTEAFQPKVRIFSTMGQPDWLAAYLAILIPIAIVLLIKALEQKQKGKAIFFFLLSLLFYIDLLFTRARTVFIALWLSLIPLALAFTTPIFKTHINQGKKILATIGLFLLATFLFGSPLSQLDPFTLQGIQAKFTQKPETGKQQQQETKRLPNDEFGGGTDSGKIRMIVWKGAIDAFLHNPLFGTGVETFAFAYYKYRPTQHNLTSEWDYLYNKAHNEYLNYLATTGIFGLGTYLLMIAWFLVSSLHVLFYRHTSFLRKVLPFLPNKTEHEEHLLAIGLLASYITILLGNFAGFSVVMVSVYLFLIPGFIFILLGMLSAENALVFPKKNLSPLPQKNTDRFLSLPALTVISVVSIITIFGIITLFRFWIADKAFAMGYNLDRAGRYQDGYGKLHEAVAMRQEPTFLDELSVNDAVLASAFSAKDATSASALAQEAITTSNKIVGEHPNNIVFWKTRVRLFYTLAQSNPQYLTEALAAIKKANMLAPTDAKVSYNLGVISGQNGNIDEAIQVLQNTIRLKPDYRDAYYAIGLFYHEKAVNKNGKIVNPEYQEKAVSQMNYILTHIGADDVAVKKTLESWK